MLHIIVETNYIPDSSYSLIHKCISFVLIYSIISWSSLPRLLLLLLLLLLIYKRWKWIGLYKIQSAVMKLCDITQIHEFQEMWKNVKNALLSRNQVCMCICMHGIGWSGHLRFPDMSITSSSSQWLLGHFSFLSRGSTTRQKSPNGSQGEHFRKLQYLQRSLKMNHQT